MSLAGLPSRAAEPVRVPAWVREKGRVGIERWEGGEWASVPASADAGHNEWFAEHFLQAVRNPLDVDPAHVPLGLDDLSFTRRRPRHSGLDLGARVLGDDRSPHPAEAGCLVRPLVQAGWFLPGANLQRVLLLRREMRLRAIVQIRYEHVEPLADLPGAGTYATNDPAFHHDGAWSRPVRDGDRIAGVEVYEWVPTPLGWIGRVKPGTFKTLDRLLRERGIGKGAHLHMEVEGVHAHDRDDLWQFLNVDLVARLGYARLDRRGIA